MNNNDDIEILDDLDLDIKELNHIPKQDSIQSDNVVVNEVKMDIIQNDQDKEINKKENPKEELENPVVEMINNKSTMRLIIILLVILFIAVFLMPKVFELIND